MNPSLLLDMVASSVADRPAINALTYGEIQTRAVSLAGALADTDTGHLAFLDEYSEALPVAFYAAQHAGVPFVPLNYRLSDETLRDALSRIAPAVVLTGAAQEHRCAGIPGVTAYRVDALPAGPVTPAREGEVSLLLFTSGTSGAPKVAVLRPGQLSSYVLSTVEFLGSGEDEAQLVAVPPYHIAGISTILTSFYAGRRVVVLPSFTPEAWVDLVQRERVTHAMVVPTMLGRILQILETRGLKLPSLRHLSYGGGRMPLPVVKRTLGLLPHVDLVNAYGLTETSSTIAILGPEDHRAALASTDPAVRNRLGSVSRPLPSVEVEIRGEDGTVLASMDAGEIYVRGEQVSGEYVSHRATDASGWFPTRDRGFLDDAGYLFLEGRADDVIVRGGENLSPGEIEDALLEHEAVAEALVVGVADLEWGEVPCAAVVPTGPVTDPVRLEQVLRDFVRARLRSAKTPVRIAFRTELPSTDTGKPLRRVLQAELALEFADRDGDRDRDATMTGVDAS
jgi:fatty-acyl-CoA synthase